MWKVVLYFVLVVVGSAALMQNTAPFDDTTKLLIQAWGFTVVGLPVYWGVKAIVKGYRGK